MPAHSNWCKKLQPSKMYHCSLLSVVTKMFVIMEDNHAYQWYLLRQQCQHTIACWKYKIKTTIYCTSTDITLMYK